MFLVLSAHRATYLYGASSSSMRNLMPTYALQRNAIAQSTICLAFLLIPIPHIRCMASIGSNKALEERSSISLAVGIILLTTKSTTILLPKKWVCKDIMRHELSLLFAK